MKAVAGKLWHSREDIGFNSTCFFSVYSGYLCGFAPHSFKPMNSIRLGYDFFVEVREGPVSQW